MSTSNDSVPSRPAGDVSRRTLLTAAAATSGALVAATVGSAAAANPGSTAATGKPLNGKAALVTGSSRGIGAATARRLALDGYRVTVNCVTQRDLAERVVRDIRAAGGEAIWEQADVSDPRAVRRLFDATERAFGGVDVVVSNAGIMRLAPFSEMTDADFDRMVDVNLKGSFHVLREAARRVRDGGRILALSSSITQLRSPTYGPYAASKGAQELYANILAKELSGRQIAVNAIAPGVVNTTLFTDGKSAQVLEGFAQRTPHRRLGEPADIAAVISLLCSSEGGWINGQTVFANGGIV